MREHPQKAVTGYDSYISRKFFGSLDGARCLSILAVLWHHADAPPFIPIAARGFLGVDMFFVLSGFLITTLLLRERTRTGEISLRNFYFRRTLRIFPAYYGLLLALSVVYATVGRNADTGSGFFQSLPFLLLYLSNWSILSPPNLGIAWSLATEEQFYLFWPAVQKYISGIALWVVLMVLLFVSQLMNFGVLDPLFASLYGTPEVPSLPILQVTFTPILLGVVLAHVLNGRATYDFLIKFGCDRIWAAPLLALAILAFVNFGAASMSGWPRVVTHLLMTLWLATLVVRESNGMAWLLHWRPIVRLGEISYGVYLYHMFAFHFARSANERLGWDFPLALLITGSLTTVVVAELSFRFYESLFLKWKQSFSNRADATHGLSAGEASPTTIGEN